MKLHRTLVTLLIFALLGLFTVSAQDAPIDDFYEFNGVSMGYLPELTGEPIGEFMEESIDRMTEWPAARMVQFPDYALERRSGLGARVMVFPVEDFRAIDAFYAERMDGLNAIVNGEMMLQLNMEIPRLPAYPAANPLVTHLEMIEFMNGSGVRYVTMNVQNTVPPVQELEYVFIGFTSDAKSLIHASFPVNASWLPTADEMFESGQADALFQMLTENDSTSFAVYEAYMLGTAYVFDGAPAESFTPGLDALDALIASLAIDAG